LAIVVPAQVRHNISLHCKTKLIWIF
jgi:hypothetical protein